MIKLRFDPDVLMTNVVKKMRRNAHRQILQLMYLLVTENYTRLLIGLFVSENGHEIDNLWQPIF